MKIPYNDAVGKTFEDAELVSDSNVDLYKWISPRPLTEDESNMPADSLATWAMHQANLGWSGNHGAFLHKIAITLKKQQAEIDTYKSQNNSQIDTYRYKNLTDGEILDIYLNLTNGNKDLDILEFAEMILKKNKK